MSLPTALCYSALVCVLVVPSGSTAAQPGNWRLLPQSPVAMIRLDDASFIDARTGWVVDTQGLIYQTTDGGDTWTQLIHDQTDLGYRVLFRSIGFANERVGWVGNLGQSSQNPNFQHILHGTTDGGKTWTDLTDRIEGTKPAGLCGLWVVNEQVAYGVGRFGLGPSTFLKTTDGGQSWISTDMTDLAGVLIDAYFFDENNGLIIGSTVPDDGALDMWEDLQTVHAAVFTTSDGGETWTLAHQTEGLNEWGWKISFPTSTIGYVSVQGAHGTKVLKTTDGGVSWSEAELTQGTGGSAIGFVDGENGWTGGEGTVFTTDGGAIWQDAGFGDQLNRIRVLGDSLAFAVGDRVYRYEGSLSTLVESETPRQSRLEQNFPNPFGPYTTIVYRVEAGADVHIVVQDALGRHVTTLVDRPHEPGRHQVVWNGSSDAGYEMPSGLYFYRLAIGNRVETKAMALQR